MSWHSNNAEDGLPVVKPSDPHMDLLRAQAEIHRLGAEVDRLRAELTDVRHHAKMWYVEKLRAEAATARVRKLCAESNAYRGMDQSDRLVILADDILRSLDGDTE